MSIGDNITTVIVDTQNYNLALNALINSTKNFPTKEVIVFSDQPKRWKNYSCRTINKIRSIEDYNHIILNDIVEHINTDFVLIIQYDGFVINPQKFTSEFLEVDYIGAPWNFYNYRKVGNGGFSLRSKRLCEAVKKYAYLRPPGQAEDYFICKEIGDLLEYRHGIKFAPRQLAEQFSIEGQYNKNMPFGFHGIATLPFIYRNHLGYLLKNLHPDYLRGMPLRQLAKSFGGIGGNALGMLKEFLRNGPV
jgi:hypothetical protein